MASPMTTGTRGIELIKQYEGFRDKVYKCPAGYDTIGYGHRLRDGENFYGKITKDVAERLLKQDLRDAEVAVCRLVQRPLKQSQFDALVSFVYNLGADKFAGSTLLKKINAKQDFGVPQQLLLWMNAGGKPQLGLLRRRCAEAALYLED